MDVRDMKGNPGIWEELSWEDLSSKEKELWSLLGWQQDKWDENEAPASSDKAWKDLNYQEQSQRWVLDLPRISGTILRINNDDRGFAEPGLLPYHSRQSFRPRARRST